MLEVKKKDVERAKFEYQIMGNDRDNFTAQLLRLIIKTDLQNFWKLARVYPAEAYVIAEIHGKCDVSKFKVIE